MSCRHFDVSMSCSQHRFVINMPSSLPTVVGMYQGMSQYDSALQANAFVMTSLVTVEADLSSCIDYTHIPSLVSLSDQYQPILPETPETRASLSSELAALSTTAVKGGSPTSSPFKVTQPSAAGVTASPEATSVALASFIQQAMDQPMREKEEKEKEVKASPRAEDPTLGQFVSFPMVGYAYARA